ncbi:MAG: hypothetical protein AUJ48_01275 [Deltaproteobacteria bacterium CG1_02_45_11]|nr:MAG: hypothetical protein AUJ48_01275 [Deltaproteobacteria bacterium CG1_02_45_11]
MIDLICEFLGKYIHSTVGPIKWLPIVALAGLMIITINLESILSDYKDFQVNRDSAKLCNQLLKRIRLIKTISGSVLIFSSALFGIAVYYLR